MGEGSPERAGPGRGARRGVVLVAVLVSGALLLAGCTGGDDSGGPQDDDVAVAGSGLYLVDGNVGSPQMAQLSPDVTAGAQGTLPGEPLSADFVDRLDVLNPRLAETGYAYAGQAYDAAVLIALSAQAAGADGGADMAAQMSAVSSDGQTCSSFDECRSAIAGGEDVDYEGVSGAVDLDTSGDVTSAPIAVYQFPSDGSTTAAGDGSPILGAPTSVTSAEASPSASGSPPSEEFAATAPHADGQLVIGGFLPGSGSLAATGRSQAAGVRLAVQDLNAAGGVLGRPVLWLPTDAGDPGDTDAASTAVSSLLAQPVDAVIGGAASSQTMAAIPSLTGAGVLQVSPSSTAPGLTDVSDGGLFFRTAPTDTLQASVLAGLALDQGAGRLTIVARDDDYGRGLARSVAAAFTDGGGELAAPGGRAAVALYYDPSEMSDAAANRVARRAADLAPDAVVVIGYDESAAVVEALHGRGVF